MERPDRRSVIGAKSMVLEDVKYVKTTLIRYQRDEAKKTLATLRNGIKVVVPFIQVLFIGWIVML